MADQIKEAAITHSLSKNCRNVLPGARVSLIEGRKVDYRKMRIPGRHLKLVPQRELHLAWRSRVGKLAERARRRQPQARVDEVDVVECVERFGAELQAVAFHGH